MAFVLGLLAVFAMPPIYQIYLLIPAFSGLLWMAVDAPTRWKAFVVGWWFGAGFFTGGLYWVSFALLVDAEKFAWLMPIAIFGFAFGLGLFVALNTLVVRMIPGDLTAKAMVLAGTWVLLEWIRSWIFTGLPWNPLGSVWAFADAPLQVTWLVGVFGLSLFTALLAVMPGTFGQASQNNNPQDNGPIRLLIASVAAMGVVWVGGSYRLADATDAVVDGVRLRLIQPNIPQNEKWKPELRQRNIMAQVDLALSPPKVGEPTPTHIIWAETSAPFFIENSPEWRRLIGAATPKGGLTILGAPRVLPDASDDGSFKVANALLALDDKGRVTDTYDKFHLVPFGEYVPLSDWLPLDKITQGQGAFTPGPGLQTLNLKGLPPVSPLICYEVIFPGAVVNPDDNLDRRAQWLLNLTNDAWYGATAGPHQHFVSARLRAVEEGLPAVRVAFTGISGIVDAYGRTQSIRALGEKGFVDGGLPIAVKAIGPYSQYGDVIPVLMALLTLLLASLHVIRNRT
ncbi:MAG: apolipoprotein N-acyltransferase [Magnetovibrio sp.]|nr:apolipoprotein N-acyltransferase [Magnetovibrio sp.]